MDQQPPDLFKKLSRHMTEEQLQYCAHATDLRPRPRQRPATTTKASSYFCDGIIHQILEAVQSEARRRYPARFQHKPFDVLFAKPINDPEAWKVILDEIEARFANTHKKPFSFTSADPLREQLEQLVPWRMERIQAAWTPQSRRFPQDIAFTHRGAALRLNSGELVLESEDMGQITYYPKQRYARPVQIGLFFFGFPKETKETQAPNTEEQTTPTTSTRPLHGFDTELWFEDPPREVDKKLQYSLARLHVNMGHAPRTELIRLLAASGNLSRKVLQGLDCPRCGSCLRMTKPRPPPVSSAAPAFTDYFGEVLQADLVYIRTITGVAVPVLGMTCEATNYHAGKALTSRNPSEVLQTILEIWYRPLGLPLHFKCDAGGEFAAEVAAWNGRSGILHEVIPAEAHHRLGKIERRNSLMRSLTERIIDERGIHNIEEMNKVLPAVTFSMNSSTYSYGRSPFQAVFGRVPRPLGDLSSDPRSLVLSPGEGEKRLAPELLRADALKALAEFNASSAVRRALLRKTRHQNFDDFQPGQPLAYWRWSGRSRQHKKGAWSLGRFLSFDPDRKSLWLQVGTTTVKVASNQVRHACGWEEWTPSAEDMKILRDAEQSLKDSLWEDHTEEPPGLLQEPTGEPMSLSAPLRLPPELLPGQDHWRFTDSGITRVHVTPPRELYVPQPEECHDFDLENLADQRRTYRNEAEEQPPEDQWREPLAHQSFEPPWTGTTTFFWRLPPGEQPQRARELPLQLPPAPSVPMPQQGPAQQQRTHLQQQQQTHEGGPRLDREADQQQQPRTYIQQQQQTHVGPVVQNIVSQQDNRSITFSIPGSPVPPTPRNTRRPRSRTPSRRASQQQPVEGANDSAQYLDSAQYQSPELVPPTPVSPVPGTPDWTGVTPQQPLPGLEREGSTQQDREQDRPASSQAQGSGHAHNEHHEAAAVATPPGSLQGPSLPQPFSEPPASRVQSEATGSQDGGGSLLPQKRTAAVLMSNFPLAYDIHDNGEITLRETSETKDGRRPFQHTFYYKCYLASDARKEELAKSGIHEEPDREDDTTDDEELHSSNDRSRSRQEAKQLDREIPWRQLVDLPRAQYEEYLQATRVEAENWMTWGGIQPISHREAKHITGTPGLARRILRARAAYRDKAKGIGPLRPKCRVVIIGCQDPDLFDISRDSPTPTRLSETLLMTIATAGVNGSLGRNNKTWSLWVSDAKSAFLQGEQDTSERSGPLYMRPPRDPLIVETNSFPAELYKITGNCYGLPNAPRVWYMKVHNAMTSKGFSRHTYDRCLYYYLDPKSGELQAVVIIHVDDFLATYSSSFPILILEKLFTWGSITRVTTETSATYRGKEIRLLKLGNKYKYVVTRREFIQGMEGGRLPRGRGQQPEALTPQEWADFRSIAGSLQWLAGQCRPEIGPLVSLSNRGKDTTYKDLQRLFEAVIYLKETCDRGLVYQDIQLDENSVFVTYTDSSFANAELKSQFGVCVFVSNPAVTSKPTPGTLIDWRSARSTRICRSTLAAEASAADEGADRALFANLCLSEILLGEPAVKGAARFANVQVSDAKSLYDTVVAENPSVSDKRSLINIRSIQQSVRPKDFRWVPTEYMIADGLTKLDWKLTESLSSFLQNPVLILTKQVPKENITSVKVPNKPA